MCSNQSLSFSQLNDIISENVMLRGKITTLREHYQSAELETKASRETIMRLVSEAEREQRTAGKFSMELERYKMVSLNFQIF